MVDGPETVADTLAPGSTPAVGMVGKKLGAYRIEALIGEGAMGEVYRGMHEKLQRPVAIKTLKPAVAAVESMVERFFAEARAVNVIRHENIVECTDLVNDPGGANYIVMELLSGRTLKDAINEAGAMTPRRAVRIAAQIADAIAAAHDAGIVHRDLKPDNVFLIKRAGSPDYVKVLDFGIARLRPDLGAVAATQSGAMIGTPAYMSPEQVKGERAGPPADIYALGVILYQMLTGSYPFNAASVPLMLAAHVNEPVPKLVGADIPPALAALVEQMLAKEPEQRPETMHKARAALLEAVGLPSDVTASALSIPTPQPFRAPNLGLAQTVAPAIGTSSIGGAAGEVAKAPAPRRRTLAIAGGGVVVAAIGAIVIVMATGHRNTKSTTEAAPGPTTTTTTTAATPTPPPNAPVMPTTTPDAGVDPDVQLNAALYTLESGAKCEDRKAAIATLVRLGDPRAIPALKRARFRFRGGVLGIGDTNTNACLKADADAAIVALGGEAPHDDAPARPKTAGTTPNTAKTPKQPANTGSAGSAAATKPPEPPKVKDKTRELIDDDGSAAP